MNPVIYILFSEQSHHVCYFMRSNCAWAFDGPGSALAHAFLLDPNFNQTDIHFDSEKRWDYSMDIPVYKDISFFVTLVHEIGHAFGLDHSSTKGDLMYAYYGIPSNIHKLTEYQLSSNDINAIQFLHGQPLTREATTNSMTTTPTTDPVTILPTTAEITRDMDICDYRRNINTFVIINKKIFALYKDLVWVLDLKPDRRQVEDYTKPKRITEWLTS